MQPTATVPVDRTVTIRSGPFLKNVIADIRYRPRIWWFMGVGSLVSAAILIRARFEKVPSPETQIFTRVVIAFAITSAFVIARFAFGHLGLATKHILTFSPEGIEEEIGRRRISHGWDALRDVSEDSVRLLIVFDAAQPRYRLSILDKRTAGAAVARLLELCADHAEPEIARFARARISPRESSARQAISDDASARAAERRSRSSDLN